MEHDASASSARARHERGGLLPHQSREQRGSLAANAQARLRRRRRRPNTLAASTPAPAACWGRPWWWNRLHPTTTRRARPLLQDCKGAHTCGVISEGIRSLRALVVQTQTLVLRACSLSLSPARSLSLSFSLPHQETSENTQGTCSDGMLLAGARASASRFLAFSSCAHLLASN